MNNKVAIVIGSTGLVGNALVNQLILTNYQKIITFTRRPAPHGSAKVINQVVDFDHLEQHAALFNADVLFSCLGTTKKRAGSIANQRKVDVDYQFSAAQLAAHNAIPHYILVSSSGANVNSTSSYLKMKGELEQQILILPFKRISIVQPSLLLGTRNHDFRLGEKMGSYLLPFVCKLPALKKYRPIRAEQVALKIQKIADQPGPKIEYFKLDELF